MIARYIIGRAGSGKSALCLDEIRGRLQQDVRQDEAERKLLLIVPEQATFKAEHALVTGAGAGGFMDVQVLSLRRLAYRVMQETGGLARVHIADNGKKMLLRKIVNRVRGELRAFGVSSAMPGFIDRVSDIVTEMKRYRIEPGALAATDGAAGLFADKLRDIALIFGAYEQELAGLYIDTEDDLQLLAEQFGASSYARNSEVWIDGFNGFTPRELAVIGALIRHSRQVSVALCVDRLYEANDEPDELELFYPTACTLIQLRRIAAQHGARELHTLLPDDGCAVRHAASPMLAHIERHYGRLPAPPGASPAFVRDDVRLAAAPSRRAEAEAVARRIVALVRDESFRYRDIAVFIRNLPEYRDLLATAFDDFGIPHFFDQKRSVTHHPLIEFIRSALDIVRGGWRYDAVFRAVKTDMLFAPEAASAADEERRTAELRMRMDRLENYALAYGIHGGRWTDDRPWTYAPPHRAFSRSADDERERLLLEEINDSRALVSGPLAAFERALGKADTVREMVVCVYELLERVGCARRLDLWTARCLDNGRPERAREHSGMWSLVIDVFDQLVEMMGDEAVALADFCSLLDTGLEDIQLGLVPPALDQVLIGSMDRTRPGTVKHAFILGANDGVLPSAISEDGLLTERERGMLAAVGLELAPDSRRRLLDEQFMIYTGLSVPSHSLWISYPASDDEGKALLPSELLQRLRELVPQLKVRAIDGEGASVRGGSSDGDAAVDELAGRSRALSDLLLQLRRARRGLPVDPRWWDVYNWFVARPAWRDALRRRALSLFYTNREQPLSPEASRLLYGVPLRASVSRMELFSSCHFAHFANYGLKLRERRTYKLEAPDIGQLFHAALSMIGLTLQQQGRQWDELDAAQCAAYAAKAVDELTPQLQSAILSSSNRYTYLAHKLKRVVGRAAAVLAEFGRAGSFRPEGLELAFGPDATLPALRLPLDGGTDMDIIGRIDRVDRAQGEQGALLRVIDYKSSSTRLDLTEVYYGLSLQMLAYLDVAVTHSRHWLGEQAQPAGLLYFHVHEPLIRSSVRLSPEQADEEMLKRFKTKGLVIADDEVIRLMDGTMTGGKSRFIPVAMKADGSFYKYASVMTPGQWKALQAHSRSRMREIGSGIMKGSVEIAPYRLGTMTACQYCSFKPVCQFDPEFEGNGQRLLAARAADELWPLIEQKGETGDG